jgi:hypothetical protein
LVVLTACSSSSKLIEPESKPEFKPEIPVEILNQRGIAYINSKYKRDYFEIMPYLFYNENNTFNGTQGDFYNVTYKNSSNLNIMVGYWEKYGDHKNVLVVFIALTDSSTLPLKGMPITVESSKHGKFINEKLRNTKLYRVQQRVLFVKELQLENRYDILDKMIDDVITVTIDGEIYHFLNPELELN